MKQIIQNVMFLTFLSIFIGCNSDDDGVACFSCLYEQQRTGCNNNDYGDWEEKSLTINEPKDGLVPEQFCNEQFPATDLFCESSCCIRFRHRNVRVGPCQ